MSRSPSVFRKHNAEPCLCCLHPHLSLARTNPYRCPMGALTFCCAAAWRRIGAANTSGAPNRALCTVRMGIGLALAQGLSWYGTHLIPTVESALQFMILCERGSNGSAPHVWHACWALPARLYVCLPSLPHEARRGLLLALFVGVRVALCRSVSLPLLRLAPPSKARTGPRQCLLGTLTRRPQCRASSPAAALLIAHCLWGLDLLSGRAPLARPPMRAASGFVCKRPRRNLLL